MLIITAAKNALKKKNSLELLEISSKIFLPSFWLHVFWTETWTTTFIFKSSYHTVNWCMKIHIYILQWFKCSAIIRWLWYSLMVAVVTFKNGFYFRTKSQLWITIQVLGSGFLFQSALTLGGRVLQHDTVLLHEVEKVDLQLGLYFFFVERRTFF